MSIIPNSAPFRPRMTVDAKNLNSANIYKLETLSKLQSEVQLGRMIGPFKEKPISTLRISQIELVVKSDGGWRLITHLFFPEGGARYSTAHGQVFVNPIFILKLYSKMVKIRRVYY
jgi:hypothetical protein